MNYYEKSINTFLSSVASNMSAIYLPAFFVALIRLLEDYYKFDVLKDGVSTIKNRIYISFPVITAYFLNYILRIRNEVPGIKVAPTRGRTHDERLIIGLSNLSSMLDPLKMKKSRKAHTQNIGRITPLNGYRQTECNRKTYSINQNRTSSHLCFLGTYIQLYLLGNPIFRHKCIDNIPFMLDNVIIIILLIEGKRRYVI